MNKSIKFIPKTFQKVNEIIDRLKKSVHYLENNQKNADNSRKNKPQINFNKNFAQNAKIKYRNGLITLFTSQEYNVLIRSEVQNFSDSNIEFEDDAKVIKALDLRFKLQTDDNNFINKYKLMVNDTQVS